MTRALVLLRSGLSRRSMLRQTAGIGVSVGLGGVGRASAQDATPGAFEHLYDVVYGSIGGEDLVMDIARPLGLSAPQPAVVLIHGGGLVDGTRFELARAANALAAEGYVTFNIDYRLAGLDGSNSWPAQLDDVQRAVRWVRANAATYNVDPERIGAFGWASCGQLAAFLGTRETRDNSDPALASYSSKVTCVVSMAGNFDMTIPFQRYDRYDSLPNDAQVITGIPGGTPTAEQIGDFSPIAFVDEGSAPFLILQEGNEDVVPYEHSRRMVATLQDAGVQVSYGWFPEYTYFSWGAWAPEAPETLAFFGRHLRA